MKAHVLYGAITLGVIACSRPDSALFGPDAPEDIGGPAPLGGTAPASGGSGTSGGKASQGGTASPPVGGTSAGGGTSGGTDPVTGGAGEPADAPGGAGQSAGGADSPPDPPPEPPPAPVCGNGIIEPGEECDDANQAGMDGCEKCQVMCTHFGAGSVKSSDHHCYRGYDQATFEVALDACQERGAHLVTISSADENALVRELVNTSKFLGGWEELALTEEGKGAYGWITGEPLTYTNWSQKEPDMDEVICIGWGNQRCYEHCMVMTGQGTWEDRRCDQPDGYVCEWEPAESAR